MKLVLRKQGKTFGRMLVGVSDGSTLAQRLNPRSSSVWFDTPANAFSALLRHHLKDEEPLR